MVNPERVAQLAYQRRIGDQFINYRGDMETIPTERKARMLSAMGYDLDNEAAVEAGVYALDAAPWKSLLRPVYVITPGPECGIEFHLSDDELDTTLTWTVTLEYGAAGPSGEAVPSALTETGEYWLDDVRYSRRFLPIPAALALGYHRLSLALGNRAQECSLIMAPTQCYQNEAMAGGATVWGTAIQLYTLRSERNWGMGDFTDLEQLLRDMSAAGAGFVGLNPIHALYPATPEHASPYSPSNRSFLNPLYVDVERVPEFADSPGLRDQLAADDVQQTLADVRAATHVDYGRVGRLKYQFFRAMFDQFSARHLAKDTPRAQAFRRFVEEGGDPLLEHATFEALLAHFKAQDIHAWGWPVWPEAYQDHHSEAVRQFVQDHPEDVAYYQYLQFIADEQLREVNATAEQSAMTLGLYRDLAVGADRGGAEVWSNRERFCTSASVGAPPDALGPTGQNWGLPPLDPVRLEEDGYQAFITLVRNNMRGCGALRIDHAMALFRLWWCPPDADASEGAYVHYNLDHLLGILCLESQRNQCLVIAEDLGTVPEEVRERFPKAQLYSNKVFYFETNSEGTLPPNEYEPKSLTIVANHDMPTLKAFWNKSDLDLRAGLGMFPSAEAQAAESTDRDAAKARILEALDGAGLLPSGMTTDPADVPEMTTELSYAIHWFLGSGSAQMVAVQLEDLLLVNDPVNVPGTSDQYPNWQRKLTADTQDIFADASTQHFATRMTRIREGRG